MSDEVTGNHDRLEAAGDEDSLLFHAELVAGAVSSILHDSDLRRVGALLVEEAVDPQFCPSAIVFILWVSYSPIIFI